MNNANKAENVSTGELLEVVARLTGAVGRSAAHAKRALEEAARLGDIVRAQQGEIDKLGAAVQLHQKMFEAIVQPTPVDRGQETH